MKGAHPKIELTSLQEGMLFHSLAAPGSGVDVEQIVCRAHGVFERARFVHAFEAVCARHTILRSCFERAEDGRLVRFTRAAPSLPTTELDWSDAPEPEREARLARLLEEDRRTDFDPFGAPMMRLCLVRWGAERHVVIWTFHHALLDGRSFPIVLDEVFEVYRALGDGREPRLPPPADFDAFVEWDAGLDHSASRRYFADLLDGFDTPTPIGFGFPHRSFGEASRGRSVEIVSDVAQAALQDAAERLSVTPNTLFQAAWAWLLSRFAGGQPEVVFGATRACRSAPLPGIREMVGLLINTVPVRVPTEPDLEVGPWLAELRAQHVAQRPHERLSLAEIQRASAVPAGSPLFETLVVFDDATLDRRMKARRPELSGWRFDYHGQTNYPVTLVGYFDPRMTIRLEVDPARIDLGTAERVLQHFLRVLLALCDAAPSTKLRSLRLLSASERAELLGALDAMGPDYPRARRLHEGFEAAADRRPDSTAVVCAGAELSYAELEARANRLAHHLRGRGVEPGQRVALCLPRSLDLVVALLAVPKAGAVYVPLEPTYPEARIRFVLEETEASVVIVAGSSRPVVPEGPWRVVDVDGEAGEIEARDPSRSSVPGSADDLAYVIYTSGSEGRPKGVAVAHRPASNLFEWIERTFGVGPQDRLLFTASVCFDLSVYDVFGVLCSGGSVHVATAEELEAPERLVEALTTGGITFWDSAPAALERLVPLLPERAPQSSLRLVFLSGDWIRVSLPDQIRAVFDRAEVIALGGATEATVWSNFYRVGEVDPRWPSIPYGRPIANARYYVLDADLEPVPVGVPGDLYIGGEVVAEGYYARPAQSAASFLPDPHVPGARIYRTGDLARLQSDGDLEFLGRRDAQVKVRGYRIELGEIEAALRAHPDVESCVVDAPMRGPDRERALIAYIVGARSDGLDPDALRAFLARALPSYMVPTHFVGLPELPLTANGKLDRRALPEPEVSGRAFEAPRDSLEQTVAQAFAECLGLPQVGLRDDFFALGGHSLLAVRCVARLQASTGLGLEVFEFVAARTPAAVAERLRARSAPPPASAHVPATGGDPELSAEQERLLFLQRFAPDSGAYNVPLGYRLRGAIDRARLAAAVTVVVDRHEPLRTVPRVGARGFEVSVRSPGAPVELGELDLAAYDAEVERLCRPFALGEGPLLRVALGSRSPFEHLLVVVVHHAVFDGRSEELFVDELLEAYDGLSEGRAPELAALPITYSDYARWSRRGRPGDDRALEYWRRTLAGPLPVLDLPAERPRPKVLEHHGAARPFWLSARVVAGVEALARRQQTTPYVVMQAAFNLLLGRFSGQGDVVVGAAVSTRDAPETEGLIGLLVETVAIRTDLRGAPSFSGLLEQTHTRVQEALEHRLPFARVVDALELSRDTSHTPVFQALLGFREARGAGRAGRRLEARPEPLPVRYARTDLSLFLTHASGEMTGYFEYDLRLGADTVERLAEGLELLLAAVTEDPARSIATAPVTSAQARRAELEVDVRAADVDVSQTLVHRVRAAAAAYPARPAIHQGTTSVCYGALEAQARSVAAHLAALGIGAGDNVAVHFERGPGLVAAMLGVAWVGAAWVPLDPDHPPARTARVFEVARPRVVLHDAATAGRLPDAPGVRRVDVGGLEPAAEDDLVVEARPERLAYVIFTSGSTGEPKGVEITHGALARFLAAMAERPGFTSEDHLLAATTVSFDIAHLELFLPLVCGGSLEILPSAEMLDPAAMVARMKARPPTVLQATPARLQMLVDVGWEGDPGLTLLCGGDTLSGRLAAALLPRCRRLFDMYGPTETTIWSSLDEVSDPELITIGRPIPDTRMYVLSEAGEPVPRGAVGELYIGGALLARGYHGRPDLTAQAFLPDPFVDDPEARMYRTGDLARRLPDGRLVHLGRRDTQVKLRGFRIELGEVEAALERHPEVERGVAKLWAPSPDDLRLVGYVRTTRRDAEVPDGLRSHLATWLPGYMVPGTLVALPELPLTANQKVDRGALPDPIPERVRPRATEPCSHQDDVELQIAAVWKDALKVPEPHRDDDFFTLGGHSLLAVQVLSELEDVFGVELSLLEFFEAATLGDLADQVRRGGGAIDAAVVPLAAGGDKTPVYFVCGVHIYQEIARALAPERAGYGLFVPAERRLVESSDLVAKDVPSVEALAAEYVQMLLEHDPTGPYVLAGLSFGGLLAFEMSRQLTRRGLVVEGLVLIDAILPDGVRRNPRKWAALQLSQLRDGGLGGLVDRARQLWAPPSLLEVGHSEDPVELLDLRRSKIYETAATAYVARPHQYDGPAVVARASESGLPGYDVLPDLGWTGRVRGGLRIVQLPGDHLGVLRPPNVEHTARLVRDALEALEPGTRRGPSLASRLG